MYPTHPHITSIPSPGNIIWRIIWLSFGCPKREERMGKRLPNDMPNEQWGRGGMEWRGGGVWLCAMNICRRRTTVQQLTCNIGLSNSFYYLFFSFVLIELKPFDFKGKALGEKFWKSAKKCENDETILPFSCCPLVFPRICCDKKHLFRWTFWGGFLPDGFFSSDYHWIGNHYAINSENFFLCNRSGRLIHYAVRN